jgi:chemotaxis protein CheY-P-specific phosphatase CheC
MVSATPVDDLMGSERSSAHLGRLIYRAINRAADTLGELLNDQVRINHCRFYRVNWRQALSDHLRGREDYLAVGQTAFGREPMRVWLALENRQVNRLLDGLMGRHGGASPGTRGYSEPRGGRFDPSEVDALKETTNIVSGSCVAVLARELGLKGLSLPSVESRRGWSEDKVYWLVADAQSLCIDSQLQAQRHPLEVTLLMSVLTPESIGSTRERTNGTSMPADALRGARRLVAGPARN